MRYSDVAVKVETPPPSANAVRKALILSIASILALLALTIFLMSAVELRFEKEIRAELTTMLNQARSTLHTWAKKHLLEVESWAQDPFLVQAAEQLSRTNTQRFELSKLPIQRRLRNLFHNKAFLHRFDYLGYFVISEEYINLASSRDENLGVKSLLSGDEDFFDRMRAGKSALSLPVISGVALPDPDNPSKLKSGLPSVFVGTPLRNNGQIFAYFVLRIDPFIEYFELVQTELLIPGRYVHTFDKGGALIRRERYLQHGNNLSDDQVLVRYGPGIKGLDKEVISISEPHKEVAEFNTTGYKNHDSNEVVGAWMWDADFQFGFLAEIDKKEAFLPIQYTKKALAIFCSVGILLVILISVLYIYGLNVLRKSHARREEVIQDLNEVNTSLQDLTTFIKKVLDSLPFSVVVLDKNGEIKLANSAWESLGKAACEGLDMSADIGTNYLKILKKSYIAGSSEIADKIQSVIERKSKVFSTEYACGTSGDAHWYVLKALPIEENHGEVVISNLEVTTLKRIENTLRESQAMYAAILDNTVDGIITIDDRGTVLMFSHAAERLFGYRADEVIGRNVKMLMPEKFAVEHDHYIEQYLRTGKGKIIGVGREVSGRKKNGLEFPLYLAVGEIVLENRRVFTGILRDISVVKNYEKALIEEKKRAELYLQVSEAIIVELDKEGGIIRVNNYGCNVLGYSADELLGDKWFARLYPDDERDQRKYEFERFIGGYKSDPWHDVTRLITKSGQERYIDWHNAREYDENGNIEGMLLTGHDITRQKKYEAELVKATMAAERANRAKSDFLSSMSHELRTPLNAIIGYAQLLELEPDLSKSVQESIEQINRASNHLLELINDVLDFSAIESGHVNLSVEEISLSDVFEACETLSESIAYEKGIGLNFHEILPEHRIVKGDFLRTKQVLLNLVSNAIKYNRENGDVTVYVEPVGECARICVKDTGPGISREMQAGLFEKFNRLGAERTEIKGAGVGLALSKKLVVMMSGRIGVDSEEGQGSVFWFELPLMADMRTATEDERLRAESERAAEPVENDGGMGVDGKILVVEDNPVNRDLLQLQLQQLGYDADVARDGVEALGMLSRHEYAAVLTDLHMPGMDGIGLIEEIRQNARPEVRELPVLLLTADVSKHQMQRSMAVGVSEHLIKPIQTEKLKDSLQKWISTGRNRINKQAHKQGINLPDESGQVPINLRALSEFIGPNPEKFKEFLGLFLDTTRQTLEEIREHAARENANGLAALGHRLKSSAKAVGAHQLSEFCAELERHGKSGVWPSIVSSIEKIANEFDSIMEYLERRTAQGGL